SASPSRHPPLMLPTHRPSSVISMRAPGLRYDEPLTFTTVASAALDLLKSILAYSATIALNSFILLHLLFSLANLSLTSGRSLNFKFQKGWCYGNLTNVR